MLRISRESNPRESDPSLLAEILVIFSPPTLPLTNGFVILDELDCADVLNHCKSKLRFDTESQRRSMQNRQRLAVHFVGEKRLRIFRREIENVFTSALNRSAT